MSAKTPKTEVKVLKGKEAEDKVLEYVKRMNRPYGAVDVAANLKGAVPKTATQKILVALAEKGELVMKTYGKTTFFVANQSRLDSMSSDDLAVLEAEFKSIDEKNKIDAANIKSLSNDLAKLRSAPTDSELAVQIAATVSATERAAERLEILRAGTPLISVEELAALNAEWTRWRGEWIRRKKIFTTFWHMIIDALSPQDAAALAEDLGIEFDTPEHQALERGPLCAKPVTVVSSKKRKRD